MAYSIKSNVIINDSRELLGVTTAGFTTALYVGEEIQAGADSGIVTAKGMVVKDSDLSVIDGGNITVAAGGSITAPSIYVELGGDPVGVATITDGGDLEVGSIDATGYVNVGAGLSLGGSLSFVAGDADEFVTGITTDLDESAGANELATAEAITSYVTEAVGDAGTLDFVDEDGNLGQVNIGAGDTLGIIGTANEIETVVTGAGNTQLQIGLPDNVVIGAGLTVTGLLSAEGNIELQAGDSIGIQTADGTLQAITHVGVNTALVETGAASDAVLPTEKAVKEYVDAVSAEVTANANLRLQVEGVGVGTVGLATEFLNFEGTANEIEIAGADETITIGLPDDVTIGGDLIVTNDFSFDGGQLVNVIGIETSLIDTTAGIATNTSIPTQQAVKEYVDNQIAETGGTLNFEGDGATAGDVDLSTQTLTVFGTANEVDTVGAGQSITIGLPADVKVTTSFIVAEGAGANSNNLLEVDSASDVVSVDGRLDVSTGATILGVCTATDFNSTSDINKKENIVEISNAVEKVEALRGVTFDWKDGSGKSGGTIAQEVQAVLPEIVKEGSHLTVNYNGLTGLLIQAVKELSARVAELEGNA